MATELFSLLDITTQNYKPPFLAANSAEAIRIIKSALNRESLLTENPKDFSLVSIGTFDQITGSLSADELTVILDDLTSLVRKENPNEQQNA